MKIELAHDILARKVYDKASAEDKMILKIESLIQESHQRYLERKVLMGEDDLEYIKTYLPIVSISPEEVAFIKKSRNTIRRKQRFVNRLIAAVIILLSLLTLVAAFQAINLKKEKQNAEHQKILAIKNAEIAKENARIAELHAKEAEENAEEARENAKIAKENAKRAKDNAEDAQKQRKIAIQKAKDARLAERKAKEALKQAKIAKEEAEVAKEVAVKERAIAVEAQESLKKSNKELEEKREEAISQRNAARKLRSLAEVRSNSTLAIRKLLEGKYAEAVLLARGAYRENLDNKGPKHNIDNYLALSACVEAFEEEKERNGEIELPDYRKIHTAPVRAVTTAVLPNQQEVIAYSTEDGKLRIYPFMEKEELLGQRLRSLAFSKEGKYLVGGTFKGELNVWEYDKKRDKNKNKPKYNYEYVDKSRKMDIVGDTKSMVNSPIHYVDFVEPIAGKEILVFADKEEVYLAVIEELDKEKIAINVFLKLGVEKDSDDGKITSVTTSENGDYIVVARTERVMVYRLNYEEKNGESVLKQTMRKIDLEKGAKVTAMDIALVDGSYIFAFGYSSGAVRLIYGEDLACVGVDQETAACKSIYLEHKSPVTKILFNDNATQLVSAALDKSGKIWNLENEEEEKLPLIGHDKWIWDMTYSADQKVLLTASQDRTIRKWSTTSSLLYDELETLCKECIKLEEEAERKGRDVESNDGN